MYSVKVQAVILWFDADLVISTIVSLSIER